MTKIDVFSGFLGAGKTTLIKKLIKEAYAGEKVVLIENEFGEIGVDGGFLKDAGVNITEMNSGCICCSLVGDFAKALKEVEAKYQPDRIIIEPSGVGKLSDVIRAVERANVENGVLNAFCAVVDANKCKMYMKNFGEFFIDQVANASCVVLSHTTGISEEKLHTCLEMLKEVNPDANYVTAEWDKLDGKTILSAMEKKDCLEAELKKLAEEYAHDHDEDEHEHCHHHHDDDDDEDGHCHHHHDDDDDEEDEHEHCHHHHDDDDEEDEHEHCHHHHHDHDGHHHADEVFTSWGVETPKRFSREELEKILETLSKSGLYGLILRAKGIIQNTDGSWMEFDFVPEEYEIREGNPDYTGRLCVIGSLLDEDGLKELFGV